MATVTTVGVDLTTVVGWDQRGKLGGLEASSNLLVLASPLARCDVWAVREDLLGKGSLTVDGVFA